MPFSSEHLFDRMARERETRKAAAEQERKTRGGAGRLINAMAGKRVTPEKAEALADRSGELLEKARKRFHKLVVKEILSGRSRKDISPKLRQAAADYDEAHARWASWIQLGIKKFKANNNFPELAAIVNDRVLGGPPVGNVEQYLEDLSTPAPEDEVSTADNSK